MHAGAADPPWTLRYFASGIAARLGPTAMRNGGARGGNALALALPGPPAFALPAAAQSWPDRPVRLVVPYTAGGATDVGARVLAEALTQVLPQPVVVENRVGAAGMIAAEFVARAPADGHTILFNNTSHAVLRVVVPNAPIDPIRQLSPIAILSEMPMVMLVSNDFPAKDGAGIPGARSGPRRGSSTMAAPAAAARWGWRRCCSCKTTGLSMNEIPYRGGAPATLDLAAGRIALVYDIALTGLQTARGGQARAFAVTSPARSADGAGGADLARDRRRCRDGGLAGRLRAGGDAARHQGRAARRDRPGAGDRGDAEEMDRARRRPRAGDAAGGVGSAMSRATWRGGKG